jgi:hypothetical protein
VSHASGGVYRTPIHVNGATPTANATGWWVAEVDFMPDDLTRLPIRGGQGNLGYIAGRRHVEPDWQVLRQKRRP